MSKRKTEIFGDRVRRIRKSNGYRLRDIHAKTGLAISFLSDIENNKRSVSAKTLFLLSNSLGVTMDNLWKGQ